MIFCDQLSIDDDDGLTLYAMCGRRLMSSSTDRHLGGSIKGEQSAHVSISSSFFDSFRFFV
jgi:hypothetical protein